MKLFGVRKGVRYGGLAGVLAAAAVAVAIAAATAQAAPSKKNYTVQVAVTNDAVSHQDFTVTIKNDGSSNTTLGSVNVLPPAGFTVSAASTTQSGWTHSVDSIGVVELRSATAADAISPGHSMTMSVHVATPTLPTTGCNATWSSTAKQSNDYNGTNNWFTLLGAPVSDLTPLGSFAWDPIGTLVNGVFAPAILTGLTYSATVDALDSCGALKSGYNGPTSLAYNGHQATVSGPTWSQAGVGTASIKPTVSETSRNLTLTDIPTNISAASDPFDTQDKICTSADTSCAWHNGNNSINANANGPATGSLGVGFDPVANVNFVCNGSGGALGGTVITISPHDTPAGAYLVTLVYSKQVSGTGSANAFIFCESTDNGATFNQLPSCAVSGTGVDCVLDQKRITGGALQIILSLLPGDPYVGGK
jgi:archaellum component FlaF (FlaF/FlaG flagellin family)